MTAYILARHVKHGQRFINGMIADLQAMHVKDGQRLINFITDEQ